MRRIAWILCCLMLLTAFACAAAEEETAYAPLSWAGAAPYQPQAAFLSEDGLSYHDPSLDVESEVIRRFDTNITVVHVRIQDPTQLRTGLAAKKYPSQVTRKVPVMAEESNAVFAVNGDYFSFRSKGVVKRNGHMLRNSPDPAYDTLMIDSSGDFHILHPTRKATWEPYQDDESIIHAFSFGPYLVMDGVKREDFPDPFKEISIDATRGHVRVCIGQTGPLEYVVFSCEARDADHKDSKGLDIMQAADVAYELGCINAYNLDGGNSACLWLAGKQLNTPWKNGSKTRPVSDIIYFATLVPDT